MKDQQQQQRQQRMDLFFNFNTFFGFADSSSAVAASEAATTAQTEAKEKVLSPSDSQEDTTPRSPLEHFGLSRHRKRIQQQIKQQRLKDGICCNLVCAKVNRNSCFEAQDRHVPHRVSCNQDESPSDRGNMESCGCEVYKEVFGYGGVAARLLIGATPVVVACVDLKLTEDSLEPCGSGLNCRFCRSAQPNHGPPASSAEPRGDMKTALSREAATFERETLASIHWRRRVSLAVQRQQLLTILAE